MSWMEPIFIVGPHESPALQHVITELSVREGYATETAPPAEWPDGLAHALITLLQTDAQTVYLAGKWRNDEVSTYIAMTALLLGLDVIDGDTGEELEEVITEDLLPELFGYLERMYQKKGKAKI